MRVRHGVVAVALATVALAVAGVGLALSAGQSPADFARSFSVGTLSAALAFATVGAVVTTQRPNHLVGRFFLALGAVFALTLACAGYAAAPRSGGALPGAGVAGWLLNWVWVPAYALLALALLVFPDSALPSRRWRPLVWVIMGATAVTTATRLLLPTPLLAGTYFVNPLRWHVSGETLTTFDDLAESVAVLALVPAAASLIVRLRRASGVRRTQLRLFCWSSAAAVVGYVALGSAGLPWLAFSLAWPAVAVAAGVGILRHGLFDIDRFVSRTVTYGAVTAVLVGVYVLIAVVPSAVFSFESDLLVAAATLAAAGVFVPVRRRVQAVVDRRFNRARYDAARVMDQFAVRLRHDVDLDNLAGDLRRTVVATVQPAYVSLWLPLRRGR